MTETLAVKSRKRGQNLILLNLNYKKNSRFFIFLLVIPKYEGKENVSFLSIPEVGEKHCVEERREKKEKSQ